MPDSIDIDILVKNISLLLGQRNRNVSTVESCTGGGIAHVLTGIAGSSQWFEYGFVTYSNAAKTALVGVSPELLSRYGAVSIEVAEAMAAGGRRVSGSDYAVSVTGIAGPGGGSVEKPVGTICFGWAGPENRNCTDQQWFDGDRESVRSQSVYHSLSMLLDGLENE